MNGSLNISVIQDNPTVGDIDGNFDLVKRHLHAEAIADLVVFPECFLTGYPLGDLVTRPGFLARTNDHLAKIRQEVLSMQGPAVLIGAPMAGATLPYNAAFLIEPNGAMRVVRKRELPNNDVFDEQRTFAMADGRAKPLMFRGYSLGVQICEDVWHGDVSRSLADELADVLIILNGSPYERGKQALREKVVRARVTSTGLPAIYVNLVGGQDELVFDGGSFVMNKDGHAGTAAAFRPDVMRLNLQRDENRETRIQFDESFEIRKYPDNMICSDYNATVLGLRDYIGKTGTPHVVVGVSGGLDSAIVLTQAVDAVGADRVIGVMMPTEFTSQESLDLADDLMRRLGVHNHIIKIDEMFEQVRITTVPAFEAIAEAMSKSADHGVSHENFQARLRGMTLMGLTNSIGGIVLSTGNKSEMSVGYATLYGDMSGGFNPLKSVYKSDAFAMAAWRNSVSGIDVCSDPGMSSAFVRNPIPEAIITRPPSAELAAGQTDQASLGDYDILDAVLKAIIEDKADAATAAKLIENRFGRDDIFKRTGGYHPVTYAEKISGLIRRAQYKRDQACPGVKINTTDFGLGWRYPIAGKYTL